jgi:hypothetical protein
LSKRQRSPTAKGLQLFLDYWLYGVLETAREFGNAKLFLRQIQARSLRAFRSDAPQPSAFAQEKDPVKACVSYTKSLDNLGVYDSADATFQADGPNVIGTIGESCLYRRTCIRVHDSGKPVFCFRATALAQMLHDSVGHDYDPDLSRFGTPCHIVLKPLSLEDSDGD